MMKVVVAPPKPKSTILLNDLTKPCKHCGKMFGEHRMLSDDPEGYGDVIICPTATQFETDEKIVREFQPLF